MSYASFVSWIRLSFDECLIKLAVVQLGDNISVSLESWLVLCLVRPAMCAEMLFVRGGTEIERLAAVDRLHVR
jgi:hypothetical protein